jgi:hypothetical protein
MDSNILDCKMVVSPDYLFLFRYSNHLLDCLNLEQQLKDSIFKEYWLTQICLINFFKLNYFKELRLDYAR